MKMSHAVMILALAAALDVMATPVVDVMLAYDQTAAGWMERNEKDPAEFAQTAVDRMNAVLPATDLDECFSFRLAGTFVSQATAPSGLTGSDRLADVLKSVASASGGVASGKWKDIQSARDRCKADIVMVLVDTGLEPASGVSVGGVSWCMGSTRLAKLTDFAKWAYGVCGVQEIEDGFIMIHEVGHLMGAGHSDRLEESPGPQLHAYSSAWHVCDTEGQRFYTIMGYPYLSATDYGYYPYPAFSSASHTMEDGTPLGDATHDNTRTLRETCADVARFRISGNEGIPGSAAFAAKTVVSARVDDADGALAGLLQITVAKTDKKGFSKVSAAFYGLNGKKAAAKSVKATVVSVDGTPTVQDVGLTVKGHPEPLVVSIGSDGSVSGRMGSAEVRVAGSIAALTTDRPRFVLGGLPATIDGFPVIGDAESDGTAYHLLPDGDGVAFSVVGRKWSFAKSASIKYVKDKSTGESALRVDTGKSGEKSNLCGLKLSVNAKTGVFKGSFAVYADAGTAKKPKLKKFKFTVTGLLVDGIGSGQAACKKAATYPVALRP